MGTSNSSPGNAVGAMCTLFKTAQGEYVIQGDSDLLRDFFEANPEQWLRCLALKEDNNG